MYDFTQLFGLDGESLAENVEIAKVHAAKGDPDAQYHLALMFDSGIGIDKNPREAESWYLKAAEQGNPNAQYYLARMYSNSESGIEQNELKAAFWYNKAADNGNDMARNKLNKEGE